MIIEFGCLSCGTEHSVDTQPQPTPEVMALHQSLQGRLDGEIRSGKACIRYESAVDSEIDPRSEEGPSVRLSTCDGRLIGQLSGGTVPLEWRRNKTALALLSGKERRLLSQLRAELEEAGKDKISPDWDRLLLLLEVSASKYQRRASFSNFPDTEDETRPNAVLVSSHPNISMSEDSDSCPWFGGSSGSSGNAGDEGPVKRDGHPRYWRSGWRFRQKIELWSFKTMNPHDHSGTIQFVYGESFDGTQQESWEYISCNHGTCPRRKKMRQYATCDPWIWTENWYNYDAECLGWWGFSHVCNDDTALQINSAYGKWNGNDCKNTKRLNRPWCGVHWE